MKRVLIAYAVVAFLTFGYSYNADYRKPRSEWSTAEEINSFSAMLAAMTWPMYWCVKAFKPLRDR